MREYRQNYLPRGSSVHSYQHSRMPCHSHREERTIALSYHCGDSEIKTLRQSLVEGSHCIFDPRARVGYEMVDS